MDIIEGQMSFADLRNDGIQVSNKKAKKIVEVAADGSWVEIFGHRLDGDFKNFEGFCNHLIKLERTESNWNTLKEMLKDDVNDYENNKWCTHTDIIRGGVMKKLLEKMEELENG